MTKFSHAVLAASVSVSLSLFSVVPAHAETGAVDAETVAPVTTTSAPADEQPSAVGFESSSKDDADNADDEQSSQGEKIALGVGITAAVLAAAAGGVFWAVQQGIIPNLSLIHI